MNIEQNEKRHFKGKTKSDIVNFPIALRRNFLSPQKNPEFLNAPISASRIIFKILNDISDQQFRKDNKFQKKQLSLFEEEFKSEHNSYGRFTFKVADIDNNNDYRNVKKGLEFLENFLKGWYKSTNKDGKTIKSYGGLISNATILDGKISFLMSSYWLEQFVLLEKYNVAYTEIPWKFSKSKQVLFYLWLLEVPDKGTTINYEKFQKIYDYNYKSAQEYIRNVLKPLKKILDIYSNRSFNCSASGDIINIVPYYTKETKIKITQKTSNKQEIIQKLNYWKQRHNLGKENIDVLKSLINIDYGNFKLFKKAYSDIIVSYRTKDDPVTELQGDSFIKMFQQQIIQTYKKSAMGTISENGYPIIEQI